MHNMKITAGPQQQSCLIFFLLVTCRTLTLQSHIFRPPGDMCGDSTADTQNHFTLIQV